MNNVRDRIGYAFYILKNELLHWEFNNILWSHDEAMISHQFNEGGDTRKYHRF